MSRPAQGGASYRAVLALPHARGLFLVGMFARLPYGLLPLPLLLALREATGSYAAAGTAAGAFGLVSALLGPYRARLAAARPGALRWLAGGFAVLLGALALLAAHAAGPVTPSPALVLVLAVATGTLAPPVGPLLRARWSAAADDSGTGGDALRQAALSLDAVVESTVFATGPLLAGLLISFGSASQALGICALSVVLGFSALAVVLSRIRQPEAPAAESAGRGAQAKGLWSWALIRVLLVVFGVAWAGASAELAVVAAWGPGVSGTLLTLLSVGGVVGGLAYGRSGTRLGPRGRLLVLGVSAILCQVLIWLFFSPFAAGPAFFLVGAATDAVLITAYLLVDRLVPEPARAEAGAWVNTAFNLGVAAGSALAGLLLGTSLGARGVLLAGPAALVLLLLPIAFTVRGRSVRSVRSVDSAKSGGRPRLPAQTGIMTTSQHKEPVTPVEPVDLAAALASFDQLWSPRIITSVNDYDVRVAKVQGEYVWHAHADTDEFFLVIDGELSIGLREGEGSERTVTLGRGSVFVVPRGVEHRPSSPGGASILMFEPTGTLSSGDYAGEIPDHIESTTGHALR